MAWLAYAFSSIYIHRVSKMPPYYFCYINTITAAAANTTRSTTSKRTSGILIIAFYLLVTTGSAACALLHENYYYIILCSINETALLWFLVIPRALVDRFSKFFHWHYSQENPLCTVTETSILHSRKNVYTFCTLLEKVFPWQWHRGIPTLPYSVRRLLFIYLL